MKAIEEVSARSVCEEVAASVCAVLAQSYKDKKLFALKDLAEIVENVGSLDAYLDEYYAFKAALCRHYSEAYQRGELSLRSSERVEDILAAVSPDDIAVITTNWDPCIWNSCCFQNVIQLHGLSKWPESIVLPGEFAADEELAEILDNHGFSIEDDEIQSQVLRMFRGDFRRPLSAALQTAAWWIDRAETVIVWGLALHPYDSEVCKLAWNASQSSCHPKRIVTVNPSQRDREVCKFLFSAEKFEFIEFQD